MRRAKSVERPPFVFGEATLIISELQQAHTEIDVRLSVLRLKLDGVFPVLDRFLNLALTARHVSQAVKGLGFFRLCLNDLFQTSAGLLVALCIAERYSQVKPSVRKCRIQCAALLDRVDSLAELSLLIKFVAALEMKCRRARQLFFGREDNIRKRLI